MVCWGARDARAAVKPQLVGDATSRRGGRVRPHNLPLPVTFLVEIGVPSVPTRAIYFEVRFVANDRGIAVTRTLIGETGFHLV